MLIHFSSITIYVAKLIKQCDLYGYFLENNVSMKVNLEPQANRQWGISRLYENV